MISTNNWTKTKNKYAICVEIEILEVARNASLFLALLLIKYRRNVNDCKKKRWNFRAI